MALGYELHGLNYISGGSGCGPGVQSASCKMSMGIFLGVRTVELELATLLFLIPWL